MNEQHEVSQQDSAADDVDNEGSVSEQEVDEEAGAESKKLSSETSPPQTVKSEAATSAPKRGGGAATLIAVIAVLLSLVLAGAAYWMHQRMLALENAAESALQADLTEALTQQNQLVEAQISKLDEQLGLVQSSVNDQVNQLDGDLTAARQSRQQLLANVEKRLVTVDAQGARIEALQARLDALLDRFDALRQSQQPKVELRWQAARDLVAVGRIQVSELGRIDTAIEHYQAARELLIENVDENSAPVITVLDAEITGLRSMPRVNYPELASSVEQAMASIPGWLPSGSAAKAPDSSAGWWDKLKFYGRNTVNIRRAQELDRTGADVLQQALRLHLLAIQAALVARDHTAVKTHAELGVELIDRYQEQLEFDLNSIHTLLNEIAVMNFNIQLPAMGQTEEKLRLLLSARNDEVNT